MSNLHVHPDDITTSIDDDLTHWVCCEDARQSRTSTLPLPGPRSFCSNVPQELITGRVTDCVVCIDLAKHLNEIGVCPVRRSCCPQFDDLCGDP